MIRKNEMEKINHFCKQNELIVEEEFISVKHTDNETSRHLFNLKKDGKIIANFEKRTQYDFDNDTIGVIWVTIEDDGDAKFIDTLYSTLIYLKQVIDNVAEKN